MKHWTSQPNGHKKQCKQLKALLKLKKEKDQMKKKLTTDDAAHGRHEDAINAVTQLDDIWGKPTTTSTTLYFIAGDRYLVHRLESEAGLLLNGQHVTLVKAIVQNGRFKCKCDDGTVKKIKPCNLKKVEETTIKEMTTNDENKKEEEECSICLDILPQDANKYARATCCGKGMHNTCREDMCSSKMSLESKNRCVMCRTKYTDDTKEGNKEAVQRLRKWVKKGKTWAQAMLGTWYRNGHGVKKDEKRAIVLFNLASEQGDVDAQFNLGCMYNNGRGVDKDDMRAVKLYTLAANQGHAGAQYSLGVMYGNGQGVNRSFAKTREWFKKAASQGHEDAIKALKLLDEMEGRTTTPSSTSSTVFNSTTIFCSYCNKPEPTNKTFNKCKGCRSVAYCNHKCQVKHWKTKPNGHKNQCKKLAAAFKTLNKKNGK